MTDRNSESAIIADLRSRYLFPQGDDAMRRHLHRPLAHDDAGAPLADTIWAALLVINVAEALECARPLADDLIRERVPARVAMDAISARGRSRKAVPEAVVHALLPRGGSAWNMQNPEWS